ncbi:uncharacterized protein LOC123469605 [Daphnia magna]|uniref:uncharacterized protein LOC123469605 n=1 Tax=Daphnia magna TaxID=35525 RepID=UPI001E1BB077|nr:uncharacterized protein LOC123469605 [Daphnia magna]
MQHQINTKILSRQVMVCKAYGVKPKALHVDGNFKLYRWRLSYIKDRSRSLFNSDIIHSDEDVKSHVESIDSVKPRGKGKDTCGDSAYTAGRLESNRKKNMDQTGVLMGSCRHGVILGAANMDRGETYRHVHFLNSKISCDFFCQDVVCKYFPFAEEIGKTKGLERFAKVTQNCTGFLSRWHGKTHSWPCQLLWGGSWKLHAAATTGEEQEQVFSTMSRYSNTTRYMSDASRRDHLSAAIGYWNRRKEENMGKTLVKRLLKARKKVACLEKKFDSLMRERGLVEEDLPKILEHLRTKAINSHDKIASTNWPLAYEKEDLEGLYLQIHRLQYRIETVAVSSKERTKLRKGITKAKKRAEGHILLVNQMIENCQTKLQPNVAEAEIRSWRKVEPTDFTEGIFPWQTEGSD